MIVQPDFLNHWKTRKLCIKLKDKCAPLYVIRLWALCQTSKTDLIPTDADTIASICEYDGVPKKLVSALLECVFIDKENGSKYRVHGWTETNQRIIHNWKAGAKGGRPKETRGLDDENPRVMSEETQGLSFAHKCGETITQGCHRPDGLDQMDQIRPDGLDRKDQIDEMDKTGKETKTGDIGSVLKSSSGLVLVSGSGLTFAGMGYSRGEMVKHACTGTKKGDIRAKDIFEKIGLMSDHEAHKICDEVNEIRLNTNNDPGYLVGVFRKKLFITQ